MNIRYKGINMNALCYLFLLAAIAILFFIIGYIFGSNKK